MLADDTLARAHLTTTTVRRHGRGDAYEYTYKHNHERDGGGGDDERDDDDAERRTIRTPTASGDVDDAARRGVFDR